MKSKLHLGDYVTMRVRIYPFLSDDILRVIKIVTKRGTENRIEVIRPTDKVTGWLDESDLMSTEKYL